MSMTNNFVYCLAFLCPISEMPISARAPYPQEGFWYGGYGFFHLCPVLLFSFLVYPLFGAYVTSIVIGIVDVRDVSVILRILWSILALLSMCCCISPCASMANPPLYSPCF